VRYVVTPLRVSARQAREGAGAIELIPLVAGFGARAKLKNFSASDTIYETREIYEGPRPTEDERGRYLEKFKDILSFETGANISTQGFWVTSSTKIGDEQINLRDSVTVIKLGRKAKSLEETKE
jgi:hypothetical protein